MPKLPPNPEGEAFFAEHCAKPGHVILVSHFDNGEQQCGVFSSLGKAIEWVEGFTDGASAFVPYVIDYPDFGNVPPAHLN